MGWSQRSIHTVHRNHTATTSQPHRNHTVTTPINSLSTSRCRQSLTLWLSLVLSISSGCRCSGDVKCRSSRLPIVEAAVVASNVDRRGCRCSSDIDRSSRAQGCRCGVKCRSSRLPLWRQMSIVEAAVAALISIDRVVVFDWSCRCCNTNMFLERA